MVSNCLKKLSDEIIRLEASTQQYYRFYGVSSTHTKELLKLVHSMAQGIMDTKLDRDYDSDGNEEISEIPIKLPSNYGKNTLLQQLSKLPRNVPVIEPVLSKQSMTKYSQASEVAAGTRGYQVPTALNLDVLKIHIQSLREQYVNVVKAGNDQLVTLRKQLEDSDHKCVKLLAEMEAKADSTLVNGRTSSDDDAEDDDDDDEDEYKEKYDGIMQVLSVYLGKDPSLELIKEQLGTRFAAFSEVQQLRQENENLRAQINYINVTLERTRRELNRALDYGKAWRQAAANERTHYLNLNSNSSILLRKVLKIAFNKQDFDFKNKSLYHLYLMLESEIDRFEAGQRNLDLDRLYFGIWVEDNMVDGQSVSDFLSEGMKSLSDFGKKTSQYSHYNQNPRRQAAKFGYADIANMAGGAIYNTNSPPMRQANGNNGNNGGNNNNNKNQTQYQPRYEEIITPPNNPGRNNNNNNNNKRRRRKN